MNTMLYVLVIVFGIDGVDAVQIEFPSKEACLAAMEGVHPISPPDGRMFHFRHQSSARDTYCINKQTGETTHWSIPEDAE